MEEAQQEFNTTLASVIEEVTAERIDAIDRGNASNGYINDWNISCHYKLIEKLYSLVRNNLTNNERTKLFLMDNLIADGRFEEAPRPRYTDMLACVAWLNRCIGNKKAAIDAYKRELALLKDEWNITKGEQVDTLKRTIELLENKEG